MAGDYDRQSDEAHIEDDESDSVTECCHLFCSAMVSNFSHHTSQVMHDVIWRDYCMSE